MSTASYGLACAISGAVVIVLYTAANRRLRKRGAFAVWWGGWILGAIGMTLTGVGWGLLAIAGPHLHFPALQAFGGVVGLAGGALYLWSARFVGRLQSKRRYSLELYTGGIYAYLRHPQALGLCLMAAGVGVATLSVPFLFGLPLWVGFWVVYAWIEERFELVPTYGGEYEEYARRTGRLLPKFRTPAEWFEISRAGAAQDVQRRG